MSKTGSSVSGQLTAMGRDCHRSGLGIARHPFHALPLLKGHRLQVECSLVSQCAKAHAMRYNQHERLRMHRLLLKRILSRLHSTLLPFDPQRDVRAVLYVLYPPSRAYSTLAFRAIRAYLTVHDVPCRAEHTAKLPPTRMINITSISHPRLLIRGCTFRVISPPKKNLYTFLRPLLKMRFLHS